MIRKKGSFNFKGKRKKAKQSKVKLSGARLEKLIRLSVYNRKSLKEPLKASDLLKIFQVKYSFSERNFYLKIDQLAKKGEIAKVTILGRSNTIYLLPVFGEP